MNSFFGGAFWFVVTLGVLVTFHEFGHFWVARRFGIKAPLPDTPSLPIGADR